MSTIEYTFLAIAAAALLVAVSWACGVAIEKMIAPFDFEREEG